MLKRYWVGAGLAVVAGIAAFGSTRSGPPGFIWTDGGRIRDAPDGSAVEGCCRASFGLSRLSKAQGEAERFNALADDSTVQEPRHRPVVLAVEASRMECLVESVRNRMWIDGFSIIRAYYPAEHVADVRDASGTVWWRCDLDH
jgi:hypothetical protein